ncbi:MAG: dTDP-4-dehydrorhamnose 3,5-epimerase [Acidimicrobiales bacterium]
MQVIDEPLLGVLVIKLNVFDDDRGSFVETYNRAKMNTLGIRAEFGQDNQSVSAAAETVRGIHFQVEPNAQGKLVRVVAGSIYDVAVDLRPASPTYLQHCAVTLSGTDDLVFWIPEGFGHAFCTLEDDTVVAYKATALYAPESDRSIRWNDPAIGIEWPIDPERATLSDKDARAPMLAEIEGEL